MLLDASGFKIDYITVLSGKEMRIFREYEKPVAEIENPKQDYQFLLEYYNTVQSGQLETISVKIVNLPTYIEVNPKLKDIMLTKDLLFSGVGRLSEINDSDWYAGNVLRIKSDCWDCEKNIQVNNHIAFEETYKVAPLLMDFQWTATGGTLQSKVAMFRLKNNGTISQTILYPNMS